jgi:hypothetical protein
MLVCSLLRLECDPTVARCLDAFVLVILHPGKSQPAGSLSRTRM